MQRALNILLSDSLQEYAEQQVVTRQLGDLSEYIRTLIRNDKKEQEAEELESDLLEAIQSETGNEKPVSPEFWDEIRAEGKRILASKMRV